MNFKPIFGLIAGAFLALNLNASTIKKGELTVATEGTYSPYSFYDEKGELVGYDVDIARAVAQKLNLKVEFLTAPWDAMLAAFDAGKADVVFNQVSITDERKKKYAFSVPYTVTFGAIITRKDNNDIKSFADLKGKKNADSATSNWAKVAVKYGAEHVVTDSFAKSMELLISRRVDAVVRDNIVFYDFIKERPNAPVKIAASLDEKDYTAAAVKKDNAELAEQISNALTELSKEGKLEAISKSYFSKDVSK
ncbi:amino acid ABC transporter substrate-binding protein [Campylobacter concisus]|uniref:amino acid ABC transporter substrate-binding protein n=1 Tax=Campylobacter concisus TaxID=199 RepID=UPI000A1DEB38|nr:amino acid ABC transporter substrate-binding protein [Campylobacter concisus]OSQ24196.1 amino acid ABC transporter substrate-binding protein [Campylobacter concisus]